MCVRKYICAPCLLKIKQCNFLFKMFLAISVCLGMICKRKKLYLNQFFLPLFIDMNVLGKTKIRITWSLKCAAKVSLIAVVAHTVSEISTVTFEIWTQCMHHQDGICNT